MVIGPNELEKKIEEKKSEAIKKLETQIDKSLIERYDGRGNVTTSFDNLNIRRFIIENLLNKYRDAGWNDTEIVYDQRDGNYLRFSQTSKKEYSRWP